MDQQNHNAEQPKHVPTEAEIARAEAEAVAALRQQAETRQPPENADFVPYVDDVPDPEPAPEPNQPDAELDDDDDGEYIPSEMEKRLDALSPEKWRMWQIVGGAAVGLGAVASLFLFRDELSTYGIIVAALLALLLPRYLERAWRRPLSVARRAMLIAMVVGLVIVFLAIGVRSGFTFKRA